jgi:hypothetical protein
MAGKDFDDDQLFSMIMELDMMPAGSGGGGLPLSSLTEAGGPGSSAGDEDGEDGGDMAPAPRVTGARSIRGRARRKGRAQDQARQLCCPCML